jgi:GNAT superfamily N-acetyltransferase
VAVRRADLSDLPALVELCRRARDEVARRRGGTAYLHREARPEPVALDLEAMLADPHRAAWIAEASPRTGAAGARTPGASPGTGAAGFATARLVPTTEPAPERAGAPALLGLVEDLYVVPEQRRRGLGRALLDAALPWLERNGALDVDALALPGDAATKSLLETTGFRARLLVMRSRRGEETDRHR